MLNWIIWNWTVFILNCVERKKKLWLHLTELFETFIKMTSFRGKLTKKGWYAVKQPITQPTNQLTYPLIYI